MAASSETAAAAAAVHAAAAPSSPSLAVAKVKAAPKQRRRTGRIDLDDRIAAAKVREAMAKAAVKAARNEAKNEKKRRARLVKKAAALSCDDLERIAKLKRSGLWDPALHGGHAGAPVAEEEVESTTTHSPSTCAASSSGRASTASAAAASEAASDDIPFADVAIVEVAAPAEPDAMTDASQLPEEP